MYEYILLLLFCYKILLYCYQRKPHNSKYGKLNREQLLPNVFVPCENVVKLLALLQNWKVNIAINLLPSNIVPPG